MGNGEKYLDKLWKFETNALVVKQKSGSSHWLEPLLNAG